MPPFKYQARASEFSGAFAKQIAADVARMREEIISPRNMQRFTHGLRWTTKPVENADDTGELTPHSFGVEARFEDIVSHDLTKFIRMRQEMATGMMEQLTRSFYHTISESTEKSGNVVVTTKDQSAAEAFLALMEKVEFAVDENGKLSLPQIHMRPEDLERTRTSIDEQGPEFGERHKQIMKDKTERAFKRERDRLARFPTPWSEKSL